MAIESTRKVGASMAVSRPVSNISARKSSQFVEDINTANNVLVRDEDSDEFANNYSHQQSDEQSSEETPKENLSLKSPLTENNIETLANSTIFDNYSQSPDINQVKIYDNNQSFIKDEETERTGRNYLKNFYEHNRHLIDIDKMV